MISIQVGSRIYHCPQRYTAVTRIFGKKPQFVVVDSLRPVAEEDIYSVEYSNDSDERHNRYRVREYEIELETYSLDRAMFFAHVLNNQAAVSTFLYEKDKDMTASLSAPSFRPKDL